MKLLEQFRHALRVKHRSWNTEKSYVDWVKQYIRFHGVRHPNEMGEAEIEQFLTHLAVHRHVAADTHNQAFSAILFLYRHVLKRSLEGVNTEPSGPAYRGSWVRAERNSALTRFVRPQTACSLASFHSRASFASDWQARVRFKLMIVGRTMRREGTTRSCRGPNDRSLFRPRPTAPCGPTFSLGRCSCQSNTSWLLLW